MSECCICGKGKRYGNMISHSHRVTGRTWKPNIRRIKAVIDGTHMHINVCTRCLRSGAIDRSGS